MTFPLSARPDEALGKGAVESNTMPDEKNSRPEYGNLNGQLGHRDQNRLLKDSDTDFPEPDAEPEHTGG